jgi:hypothetical protein
MHRIIIIALVLPAIALAQSPGEIVGWTQHDIQEFWSGTNRIVIALDRGTYVCWMKSPYYPGSRYVYFNYRDPGGEWWGEMQVSPDNFSGFGCIDIAADDCAYIFYSVAGQELIHEASACYPNDDFILPDTSSLWPKAAISAGGRLHVISGRMVQSGDQVIMYNTSTDYGQTWQPWMEVDSLETYVWILNSSMISERTALVEGIPVTGAEWQFDIGYIISEDGMEWDFGDWQMITDYDGTAVSAYADADLVFDNHDYLHVVWNTLEIEEPFPNSSTLWHWSEETGEISQIAYFDDVTCEPGVWNVALCNMSLGVDADDNLFCVWTGFDSDDSSAGGFCNGDLYMSYSTDGGLTWNGHENITDSQTPDCLPGDCNSDHWATLAETVDENLHVFYVNDKDAGAFPAFEGAVTDNPVRYLEVPNPAGTAIDEPQSLPKDISLFTSYPNPFNARTTIRFSLSEQSAIKLEIFDIAGRLVQVLADGEYPAGENSVVWDAGKRPSGVYFARLTEAAGSAAMKLVLMK